MKILNPTDKHVISFCREISQHNPLLVPLRPLPLKPINECFNIVPEHVASCGGKEIIGWTIWEWPNVMIEAEFHCVWESPDKEIIDLTPKSETFGSVSSILFVPDPEKKYRGHQVNNIRKPLNFDREILQFIEFANRRFKHMNKGSLADYHGPISPDKKLIKLEKNMMKFQNMIIAKYGSR